MARKKDVLGTREKTIHFRVSEAFYEVIAHEARQCGLSISEFCRRVLINRPIKKLPVIIHDEREIIQELRNINKVGNNLNQIARYLNEGGQMNETLSQEIRKTLTTLDLAIHDFNSAVTVRSKLNTARAVKSLNSSTCKKYFFHEPTIIKNSKS